MGLNPRQLEPRPLVDEGYDDNLNSAAPQSALEVGETLFQDLKRMKKESRVKSNVELFSVELIR